MRTVKLTVKDGATRSTDLTGEGLHLKVGAASTGENKILLLKNDMLDSEIYEVLGRSPLSDAVINSFDCGCSQIYVLPMTAGAAGSIGAVTKSEDCDGTLTVSGTPYNAYSVVIRISGSGALNTATFKYSINGGYSYSASITVPQGGSYVIPDTGLTILFTLTDGGSFKIDDEFSFTTTAPHLTGDNIEDAFAKAKTAREAFEMIHIVGESDGAAWAAAAVYAENLLTEKQKAIPIVMEAFNKASDETIEEYKDRLKNAIAAVKSKFIQIVSARCEWVFRDGHTGEINNASIVMGFYAMAKIYQSIGETKSFAISEERMLKLLPEGIEDYIDELDVARFLTFCQHNGLSGFYVTNAKIASSENSDYTHMEYTRAMCKVFKKAQTAAAQLIQSNFDSSNPKAVLKAYAEYIAAPLEDMVKIAELSDAWVEPLPDQDVTADANLKFRIFFVPRGIARTFDIVMSMSNPRINEG